MSWARLKRWLQLRRCKSRHEKLHVLENEPVHQRAATLSKTAGLLPSVFVKDYGYIPLVVANAAYVIEKNIGTRGLFQTKGTASKAMTTLMSRPKSSSLKTVGVHDAVEALKTFLVSLPDPLLPDHVLEALISVPAQGGCDQYVFVLREFLNCAPNHFAILHFVIALLSKVSQHAGQTGVDVQTLAVIFVLEIIRPLMRDNTETQRETASDRMQRLPFLIMIVETLIKNPELFKMVAAVGNDRIAENQREEYTAELASTARERSKVECAISSWGSDITYMRSLATEASRSSGRIKPSDTTRVVDTILQGPQQATNAPALGKPPAVNTLNLNDAQGKVQISGQNLPSVASLAPLVNNGIHLLVSADKEDSPSREGTVKISKLKSSPGRKPSRGSCPKKTAVTRRQKTGKNCIDTKVARNDVVEDKLSDPSLNSDFGASLLQEDISGWSGVICLTEDANKILSATYMSPKVTAVKSPVSKKLEDPTDCDKMADDTFNSTQRVAAVQESGTSNRQNPMTLTPDNTEPVDSSEDSVTLNDLVTANTGSQMTVPRKAITNRRKGKLSLKKNRKRVVNLKGGSHLNCVRCFSTSPLEVRNKGPQLLEQVSQTRVLSSPITEDNAKTVSGTIVRGSIDGDSDDYSATECPTTHQRTLSTSPGCENKAGHFMFSSYCVRDPAPSCSSGGCVRHSAGPSDVFCDNAARHPDKASVATCTQCDNNAQSLASGNQQENLSVQAGEECTSSSTRVRNAVQVRKRSPCIQCTPDTILHTPKDLQQIIIVKVFNYPRRALVRARVRTAGNKSSSGTQRPQNGPQTEQSSLGNSLEDIFVMSLALFIISLVLYHLSNSNREEEWRE